MISEKVQQEREIRHRIMAAMETGNHADARTIVEEVADLDPLFHVELQMDVLDSYGILL